MKLFKQSRSYYSLVVTVSELTRYIYAAGGKLSDGFFATSLERRNRLETLRKAELDKKHYSNGKFKESRLKDMILILT